MNTVNINLSKWAKFSGRRRSSQVLVASANQLTWKAKKKFEWFLHFTQLARNFEVEPNSDLTPSVEFQRFKEKAFRFHRESHDVFNRALDVCEHLFNSKIKERTREVLFSEVICASEDLIEFATKLIMK